MDVLVSIRCTNMTLRLSRAMHCLAKCTQPTWRAPPLPRKWRYRVAQSEYLKQFPQFGVKEIKLCMYGS